MQAFPFKGVKHISLNSLKILSREIYENYVSDHLLWLDVENGCYILL